MPDRPPRSLPRGLTLVELLVALAVLGVVASLAAPSFATLLAARRLAARTDDFVADLRQARSEAVRRVLPVAVRARSGADWSAQGWSAFTDADGDGEPGEPPEEADGAVLRVTGAAPAVVLRRVMREADGSDGWRYVPAVGPERSVLVFGPRGMPLDGRAAYFEACSAGKPGRPGRVVAVGVLGRISVDGVAAACP